MFKKFKTSQYLRREILIIVILMLLGTAVAAVWPMAVTTKELLCSIFLTLAVGTAITEYTAALQRKKDDDRAKELLEQVKSLEISGKNAMESQREAIAQLQEANRKLDEAKQKERILEENNIKQSITTAFVLGYDIGIAIQIAANSILANLRKHKVEGGEKGRIIANCFRLGLSSQNILEEIDGLKLIPKETLPKYTFEYSVLMAGIEAELEILHPELIYIFSAATHIPSVLFTLSNGNEQLARKELNAIRDLKKAKKDIQYPEYTDKILNSVLNILSRAIESRNPVRGAARGAYEISHYVEMLENLLYR